MRELRIIEDLSDETGIICEVVDGAGEQVETEPERFRLPIDATARRFFAAQLPAPDPAGTTDPACTTDATDEPATSTTTDDADADAADSPQPAGRPTENLRPREIQERIRAGASIEQLARDTGMSTHRIEPFAHPVLAERARIAELARQAHPVRVDGPAKLTLWEVLATAFAARGYGLTDVDWDARRDVTGQWIVSVTFHVGLSSTTAEWNFQPSAGSSATAVPRNTIAADLIDPDFVNPVRSLSAVDSGEPTETLPPVTASAPIRPLGHAGEAEQPDRAARDQGEQEEDPEFLQHPEEEDRPRRKRRKSVLPSWDDVLLDVRPPGKKQ